MSFFPTLLAVFSDECGKEQSKGPLPKSTSRRKREFEMNSSACLAQSAQKSRRGPKSVWDDPKIRARAARFARARWSGPKIRERLHELFGVTVTQSQIYRLKKELCLVKKPQNTPVSPEKGELKNEKKLGLKACHPEESRRIPLRKAEGVEAETWSALYEGLPYEQSEGLTETKTAALAATEPEPPKDRQVPTAHSFGVNDEGNMVPFLQGSATGGSSSPDSCRCGLQSHGSHTSPGVEGPGSCFRRNDKEKFRFSKGRNDGGEHWHSENFGLIHSRPGLKALLERLTIREPVECRIPGTIRQTRIACLKRQVSAGIGAGSLRWSIRNHPDLKFRGGIGQDAER